MHITNWSRWQSYRSDRGQPPWIKLHRCLMRNPEWVQLSDAEKGQLVSMWLLAADKDGELPTNSTMIRKLAFLDSDPDLNRFADLGFVDLTPRRRQRDAPEERRGEESRAEERQKRAESTAAPSANSSQAVPDPPATGHPNEPWLTEDQAGHLRSLMARVQRKWPSAWGRVQAQMGIWQRDRTPWDVLLAALVSTLEHEPTDPGAYLRKILRVEEPNYHEARAIERESSWKQAGGGLADLVQAARKAGGEHAG